MPGLEEFLGCVVVRGLVATPLALDGTLGWGRRAYARRARRIAVAEGVPFVCLEDGFLRSVGLGRDDPPLSIIVDDIGVYYDATTPSRLEAQIGRQRQPEEHGRADALVCAWRAARVSKYNHLREYAGKLPDRYVLVADQTFGDASIRYGLGDAAQFSRMLQAALDENPDCTVLVKIHPDVFVGRKRGHFDVQALAGMPRVRVLAEDVHPVRLIEHAQAVYVVTSQMGFEGLLWGKPVRTFGMPFYAGWGLTRDELPAPSRRGPATLAQLVHAALVDYPRYLDPETGQRCEPERLIAWMALQRQVRERFPHLVQAVGFSRWKKPIVQRFLQGSDVQFARRATAGSHAGALAVWGRREVTEGLPEGGVLRVEDGFLRSVGLGADLVRPVSWVMDQTGIYYDATAPSDLERLLQTAEFPAELIARAQQLRERIVAAGLTKYNVGAAKWARAEGAARVVLVPGQVETDASIRFGACGIRTNLELLRAARAAEPDAWLVYKPHPDVLAGLRSGDAAGDEVRRLCDEVVTDAAMGDLLQQVDAVHVLTSLAGFEALLRGKPVTCHGHPFYAGWGLTTDTAPHPRRTRRVSLDQLVAATLILYPVYVSRSTGRYTTPERALDELLAWRAQGPSRMPLWRQGLRWMLRRWAASTGR